MYQGFYLFVRLFNKYNVILTSEIEYNFWYAKRIITFYKPLNVLVSVKTVQEITC